MKSLDWWMASGPELSAGRRASGSGWVGTGDTADTAIIAGAVDFFTCQTSTQITGITSDGGYADYMIAPAEAVARVPAELSER